MHIRPRRNRRTPAIRALVRETSLTPADFILPLFLHGDAMDTPIPSMPGVTRWSLAGLVKEAGEAHALGIPAVVLFPKIEENLKTAHAEECGNDDGLVPCAIRALKAAHPTLCVITDVALDPYSSDGHDGLVHRDEKGELHVLNDETVEILCEQALCHARAGADIIAPSDMMDGRVQKASRTFPSLATRRNTLPPSTGHSVELSILHRRKVIRKPTRWTQPMRVRRSVKSCSMKQKAQTC
jgi:porphobilinogen synthase